MVYLAHRNSKTDFPVLTCAVSVNAEMDAYVSVQDRRRRSDWN